MKTNSNINLPYVIGLTGAIGTGKSLVRKMLEHKGALTIDADHLAHSAYHKGTIGYREIVSHFGTDILDLNGQISRNRLSELVFMNPGKLAELEKIVHPLVTLAVNRLISLSSLPIILVEAIKLLESDLKDQCDTIWAVTSSHEKIYKRLMDSRGMEPSQVDGRLKQQSVRHDRESGVDSIIQNQGTIKDLWLEVSARWDDLSNSSKLFSGNLASTRDLMQPFQNNLIQPDDEIQDQFATEIENNKMFFLSVNQMALLNKPLSEADFFLSNWEKVSFKYYLWKPEISSGDRLYLVSDMENFVASASASGTDFVSIAFTDILGLVQEYSSLHLCENFFFPFNMESKPLSVTLGFSENCTKFLPAPVQNPPGYSFLCKELRKPLNLFAEN